LRHEKYKRKHAQSQEGVGKQLAANVPVNQAHRFEAPF
jgi:hypothetical protein